MNSAVYKEVQREYDLKRQRAIKEAEARSEELIEKQPKYKELLEKKNKIALELTKIVVKSSGIERQIATENLEV